ncbi:MAG: transglycosylase SLT domain-containing protein [Candidatus Methylomirabilales bacterium]
MALLLGLWLAVPAGRAVEAAPPPAEELAAAARETQLGNIGTAAELLLALEAQAGALDEPHALLLGILLRWLDRGAEAIPRLQAAARDPLLGDYALHHLAAAARDQGDRAGAAEALQRLLDLHPRSLHAERAAREVPREWLEAGDLARAEAAAGRYLGRYKNGPGVASVWVTFGEVLLRSGRAEQAEQVFRRVWIELPGAPDAERALAHLTALGARPFTADERFLRASTAYRLGRYGQAVAELAPFAVAGDPYEGRARLALGVSAFNLRLYEQAIRWLLPLRDTPGPDRAEVLFWLGRSFGRAGDMPRFTETLTLLADTLPGSRRAEEALCLLAQAAADEGQASEGRRYAARLLKEYPRTVWKDTALWLEGWLAFKQQDTQAALAALARLISEEPASRLRVPALYWRGRLLEATGKPRQAADAYGDALQAAQDQPYYRMRATARLARLGKKVSRALPTAVARAAKTSGERLHAEKARALAALGLAEEAAEEYREQTSSVPEDRAMLSEACRAFLGLERYDRAVWLGKRLLVPLFAQDKGKLPVPEFWRCLYPLGHWPEVVQAGRLQGLDPLLVTALIREESTFVPRAVSRAGARGLMQVMPHTADRLAREERLPHGAGALDLPEANIQFGTLHLAELLKAHGGNLALVLASYNAGKHHVERWLARFGFADEEAFVEDIPYSETRNYVKRVLGTYLRYQEIYPELRAAQAAK